MIIALLLIINVLAPNALGSLTLLTAAIGAGLGFGAQNIVKDVLNGIFIVAEDQVGIGDVVDLGLATGIVEYVSVRVTHVRDVNGTLWYVRNGEITPHRQHVAGLVARHHRPRRAGRRRHRRGREDACSTPRRTLAKDPKWRTRIIEQPEVWGLESISGDALVIRLVMKTRANAKDDVARELRMRLKHAIDELGLALPAAQLDHADRARRRAARARREPAEDQAHAGTPHPTPRAPGVEARSARGKTRPPTPPGDDTEARRRRDATSRDRRRPAARASTTRSAATTPSCGSSTRSTAASPTTRCCGRCTPRRTSARPRSG